MSDDTAAAAGAAEESAESPSVADATRGPESADASGELSVEGLIDDLDRVAAERDAYLDDSRRIAADFANFRRQTEKRNAELVEHANVRLVESLLPVLDACEAAAAHGAVGVEPIEGALVGVLEREGLARLRPVDEPFDPALHEAVLHEPADGDDTGPIVVEVLRTGYQLKSRVIRPALVKVRG